MQSKLLKELLDNFAKRLQVVYDSREAENIAKWALMHLSGADNAASFSLQKYETVSLTLQKKADAWLEELVQGKPLQHLIGEVWFAGVQIAVNEKVLIPRPETEELVQLIAQDLGPDFSGSLLDIGTGSGCIALALKMALPKAHVTGTDVSAAALEVARSNATLNQLEVQFLEQDVLTEMPSGTYDIIVSNPPYIPLNEMEKMSDNVLQHEPHLALFTPNQEPLLFYKRIVALAQQQDVPLKGLYFELHEDYAQETLNCTLPVFEHAELVKDLQDKWRFLRMTTLR